MVDECDEVGEILRSWADAGMIEDMTSRYVRDEEGGARRRDGARPATLPGALDLAPPAARAS